MAGNRGRFAAMAGRELLHAIRAIGREMQFAQGQRIESAGTLRPDEQILVIESGFMSTAATAPSSNGACCCRSTALVTLPATTSYSVTHTKPTGWS